MTDDWMVPPTITPLTGVERFSGVDATVSEFWSFAMSDLRTNNLRGYLAEFLVARAVGATTQRVEWDAYDVRTPDGIKVEVKSSGRLQVWNQRAPSRVSFTGLKGREWTAATGYSDEATHNADVYVFAVQTAITHDAYDVLDVTQWEFYVVARAAIEATGQASIGLKRLTGLTEGPVAYEKLDEAVRCAHEQGT